jgi:PAS domain S-box-containing protein
MCDYKKTKKGLIEELQRLRSRIAELKQIEAECRKAEEALSSKTKALDAIITNLKQGIAYLDENNTIIYLNQQCADLFGLKYEDVFRKNVYNFHPPEKSGAVEALINEFKQGKQYLNMVETVGNKVLDNTFHRIQDGDGNYRGILMSAVDVTVHKKAEEALIQSEEKYRSVVENIGIGISVIGPEMEILAVNRQIKEWFPDVEVSKKPICYKTYNKPPREDICSYCPTYKSLKDGQVHESITETPAGDKIVNYRIVSSPIKDKDGKVIAAIEMVEEITERKKAEEALRESEERYKSLFQGAAEGIIVADTETKEFKYANPAVCRMLGYTEGELKRMGVCDIHPEEDLEYVISEFESQTRGERALSPGLPCLRKDGTIVYADVNTAKVLIGGRECNVGFFTDITERKRVEEAMRESEQRFRSLVEATSDWVWEVDQDGIYTYASPKVKDLLGYELEEVIGKTPFDLMPLDEARRIAVLFKDIIQSQKAFDGLQNTNLHKDGQLVVLETSGVPILDEGGNLLGYRGIDRNITERKKTEEELQKARDELEIRVEQRTRELAKANEELRKEINERQKAEEKLLIYQRQLQSLASELSLSEERLRRRIATDIHDHIGQNLAISKIKLESLAQLISSPELGKSLNDIVELIARIIESTRSLTFELSPPVLYELGFEAAMEWLVRQMREQHGLSTEFRGDGQTKPLEDNVRVLLFQAVRELLVNVAKHAQARNVTVSTQMAGNEIRVDVEDDGVGFDVSQAGSHDYKTGGFGLFSIRERLGHIGGHLNVESKRGVGTRVTLVAPIGHKEENR